MISGKLYRYKHNSSMAIMMENRDSLYDSEFIRNGDVLLCIEVESVRRETRARLLNSNGEIGWALYWGIYWEMIS
jgi:hypothetical protein